jgi:hypothetical protein
MEIRLLPAPVDPPESSGAADVSTSLVPVGRGALATRAGAGSDLVHCADIYGWSSPAERGEAPRIYGTPVEEPQSENASGMGSSAWEYVYGWAWSPPIERTATAHYLMYAAIPKAGNGRLIDVYA